MLLHQDPRSVFFLGMGTGITAGASLSFPVERVVVCELLPEVVSLAEDHFERWNNGLFNDSRATVHAEDGRNCLSRSSDQYDLIISDLFTPWKAGTGNLYTLEHFRTAGDRLEPGGLFVQWIPLYQVSEQEFGIIARTMDEAFEQVTMWRGDFFRSRSIVALVGSNSAEPLGPAALLAQSQPLENTEGNSTKAVESMLLRLYAGNVTESGLFSAYELNTDNHPYIEYLAPRTHRDVRTGAASFLVGEHRDNLYTELLASVPPQDDPFLAKLSPAQHQHVLAGWHRSRYAMHLDHGRRDAADHHYNAFQAHSAPESTNMLTPSGALLPDTPGRQAP